MKRATPMMSYYHMKRMPIPHLRIRCRLPHGNTHMNPIMQSQSQSMTQEDTLPHYSARCARTLGPGKSLQRGCRCRHTSSAPSRCPSHSASSAVVMRYSGCGRQEGTSRSTPVTEAHYLETVCNPIALHNGMQQLQSQAGALHAKSANLRGCWHRAVSQAQKLHDRLEDIHHDHKPAPDILLV